jgi:uncharacterized protein YkwD
MRQHAQTHQKLKTKTSIAATDEADDNTTTTTNSHTQNGLVSPVSFSGTAEEQQKRKQGRQNSGQDLGRLTQDELDALDALNQFRHSPQASSGTAIATATAPTS